jgi:hypothetical protein
MKALIGKMKTYIDGPEFRAALVKDLQLFTMVFVGIVLLLAVLMVTGCHAKDSHKRLIAKTAKPSGMQAIAKKDSNGRYSVELSWKTNREIKKWFIHRKLKADFFNATQIAQLPADKSIFVDATASPGKAYVYFLGGVDIQGYLVKGRAEVIVPLAVPQGAFEKVARNGVGEQ